MRRAVAVSALAIVAVVVIALEAGDVLFVQVRDTELRTTPGFLGAISDRLEFGDELGYLEERSGWLHVTSAASGAAGWVHATAVEENRSTQMQLQGESSPRTVTSREVALAGRGFNDNLEDEYGEQKELDFGPVDRLEATAVDAEAIIEFVRSAGLREDFLEGAE